MAGNMEWAIRGTQHEYGNWLDTVDSAETPRVICHAASRCLEGDRPVRQCRWDEAFDEGIGVEVHTGDSCPSFEGDSQSLEYST